MKTDATALFETGSGRAGRLMGAAAAETVAVAAMVKAESTKENWGTARRKMRRAIVFGFLNNTIIFSFYLNFERLAAYSTCHLFVFPQKFMLKLF